MNARGQNGKLTHIHTNYGHLSLRQLLCPVSFTNKEKITQNLSLITKHLQPLLHSTSDTFIISTTGCYLDRAHARDISHSCITRRKLDLPWSFPFCDVKTRTKFNINGYMNRSCLLKYPITLGESTSLTSLTFKNQRNITQNETPVSFDKVKHDVCQVSPSPTTPKGVSANNLPQNPLLRARRPPTLRHHLQSLHPRLLLRPRQGYR